MSVANGGLDPSVLWLPPTGGHLGQHMHREGSAHSGTKIDAGGARVRGRGEQENETRGRGGR